MRGRSGGSARVVRHLLWVITRFLLLAFFLLLAVLPLYWIIITSLKGTKDIYSYPLLYFPPHPTFKSYQTLFSFANFGLYFRNSIVLSVVSSTVAVLLSLFSGFGLSRLRRRRSRNRVLLSLYFTQMVPGFVLMIPLFTMLTYFRLTDNLGTLAIVYVSMMLAFSTIMAKSFFDRVPVSLEEAAVIDGCTLPQALFRVVFPVTLPGIAAIFSFCFVNIWNELFIAVMLISTNGKMTVPVALNSFISKAGISWDTLSAGIVVALLPTMIIFGIGQRYIVAGLTEGSVKG